MQNIFLIFLLSKMTGKGFFKCKTHEDEEVEYRGARGEWTTGAALAGCRSVSEGSFKEVQLRKEETSPYQQWLGGELQHRCSEGWSSGQGSVPKVGE